MGACNSDRGLSRFLLFAWIQTEHERSSYLVMAQQRSSVMAPVKGRNPAPVANYW